MKNLILICVALFVVGCASKGSVVDSYPDREIDRPYTLPDGMKSYGILGGGFAGLSDPDEDDNGFFVNPFYWETPISDNFSVVWWPLPLGLRWQPLKDDKNRVGFSFLTALFAYKAELAYRRHLADDHAVELSYQKEAVDFIFIDYDLDIYHAKYIWQYSDKQYLALGGGLGELEGGNEFLEAIVNGLTGLNSDLSYSQDIIVYDVSWGWRFHKQWNLDLTVQNFELGDGDVSSADGSTYTSFNFAVLHYWD